MDFINEFGFDVKKGKSRAFQDWLRTNEDRLIKGCPSGWEYIGTYAAVQSSEKKAGDYRQLWRHHSYADMDTFAAAMQEGGEFAQLMDEMGREFVDEDKTAHWSQSVLKSVVDTSIWGEA